MSSYYGTLLSFRPQSLQWDWLEPQLARELERLLGGPSEKSAISLVFRLGIASYRAPNMDWVPVPLRLVSEIDITLHSTRYH